MYFYKGQKDILEKIDLDKQIAEAQKEILKVFSVHNLSFLLGSGCSSLVEEDTEIGIPTMAPMAKEYYNSLDGTQKEYIIDSIKINIDLFPYDNNLEKFLEVLFSYKYLLESQGNKRELVILCQLINHTKDFIFSKCVNQEKTVIDLYKSFYRKLVYRDSNLSKINIFTTNYDLFSERALDQLGIIFSNGFSGTIERYFNPAVFNYAFAEQMELSNNKWNVIDNFIYLYKLHGSVNWIEDETSKQLFKIREIQEPKLEKTSVMIYPTPVKQNASFGSPYSDLFREFQKKLMKNNNVLITVGYSFSDEHINNLIYQALTIPTFRLVVVGNKDAININKLYELNDPRIWIIGEEGKWDDDKLSKIPVHFFSRIVNELLPEIDGQGEIEKSIDAIKTLFSEHPSTKVNESE
jgi:hypothetical protein